MKYNYARRVSNMKASDVRELLKVTETREIISLGGGLPAPELFPVEEIKAVACKVLEEEGAQALQYSTTEGYLPLRQWIARRLGDTEGLAIDADNIILTNGSQQALDLTGKLFLDEGDVVVCESPTYLAAISAFRAYGCRFAEVETDDDGMLPQALEQALDANPTAKLIYVVPTFQNPTGRTWSRERREALLEIAARRGILVVEDNPYGELRFEGETIPMLKSMDGQGNVICFGTFSKIFCPGYRLGWIVAEKGVIEKYGLAKQGTDLQCNTLAQREVTRFLQDYDIDAHIGRIRETYGRRRNLAIRTIEREFPEGTAITRPQGGLFLWLTLPGGLNARELLPASMEKGVAFVPGESFFPNEKVTNTMRINYSNATDEQLEKGLTILAEVVTEALQGA
ncbi:PLP-dependent aminotransferase family protein [Ruminococcaceae bacterium OttesenSCG-928-L11]|nr:PLP-dependent aminotransferase family protein [Ruminococcaceae bacterium OttesenSCG-928-L11]